MIWILGQESTQDRTFDEVEQKLVEKFVAGGGNLFVSGSEIGWDLEHGDHGRAFLHDTLKCRFEADDADTYEVNGVADGIFADLEKLTFDDGTHFYDVANPDVLSPTEGGKVALKYAKSGGAAAIQTAGCWGARKCGGVRFSVRDHQFGSRSSLR